MVHHKWEISLPPPHLFYQTDWGGVCVNSGGQNWSPRPPPALELRMFPQTGTNYLVQTVNSVLMCAILRKPPWKEQHLVDSISFPNFWLELFFHKRIIVRSTWTIRTSAPEENTNHDGAQDICWSGRVPQPWPNGPCAWIESPWFTLATTWCQRLVWMTLVIPWDAF